MPRKTNYGVKVDIQDGHLIASPLDAVGVNYRLREFFQRNGKKAWIERESPSRQRTGPLSELFMPSCRELRFSVNRKGKFRFHSSKHVEWKNEEQAEQIRQKAKFCSGSEYDQDRAKQLDEDGVLFVGDTDIHHTAISKFQNFLVKLTDDDR